MKSDDILPQQVSKPINADVTFELEKASVDMYIQSVFITNRYTMYRQSIQGLSEQSEIIKNDNSLTELEKTLSLIKMFKKHRMFVDSLYEAKQ